MKLISFILTLTIFVSCQTRSSQRGQISIVEIDDTNNIPKVTDKNSQENIYGPSSEGLDSKYTSEKKIEKKPRITFSF